MRHVERPSVGLLGTTLAAVVPAAWFLWPQPSTRPTATSDAVAFCVVFVGPHVAALALSAFRSAAARVLMVAFACLALAVALVSIPLYLLGAPFLAQGLAAVVVASRRYGRARAAE